MLAQKGLSPDDIDVVIYGINGDSRFDNVYYQLKDNYFKNSTSAYFKHLCGEYQTSASFAMWIASMMLKDQVIPKAILIEDKNRKPIKNVVIYNSFMKADHAVFLLSQC
jgi:3-oxoacyl-(acyl-carrier-protein) synthase